MVDSLFYELLDFFFRSFPPHTFSVDLCHLLDIQSLVLCRQVLEPAKIVGDEVS